MIARRIAGMRVFVLLLGLLLSAAPALAHSTKGLVKVPLDRKTLGVDDVAYAIEPYVHTTLYDDGTPGSKYRFFVKDFIEVTQNKDEAVVRFIVLDKKNNRDFEDSVSLKRDGKGLWFLVPDQSLPREMFTYITKSAYFWRQHGSKLGIGFALICASLAFVVWRARKKNAPDGSIPESSAGSAPLKEGADHVEASRPGAISEDG
jgi:hypothetical protein